MTLTWPVNDATIQAEYSEYTVLRLSTAQRGSLIWYIGNKRLHEEFTNILEYIGNTSITEPEMGKLNL